MTDKLTIETIEKHLIELKDPETGRGLMTMDQISDISLNDGHLQLTLGLTTHSAPIATTYRADFESGIRRQFPELTDLTINSVIHERPANKVGEIGLTAKTIIAVGSGKGGVGKSTVAASLALGLQHAGSKVGIMDADVYGPSIPQLLGVSGRPTVDENQKINPIDCNGMPVMSMGFMIPEDEAVVWRGPMLHGAITQFLRDTAWGDLDYLIIDMPPGTGDIALTLSQLIPLSGCVIVCTPQKVALLDAVKAISMFRKVNIPVLGMVENMSGFVCPDCDKRYDIFGRGGAKSRAAELNVPFLGDIPIVSSIREHGDAGTSQNNLDDDGSAQYIETMIYNLVNNMATAAADQPPQVQLPVLG